MRLQITMDIWLVLVLLTGLLSSRTFYIRSRYMPYPRRNRTEMLEYAKQRIVEYEEVVMDSIQRFQESPLTIS